MENSSKVPEFATLQDALADVNTKKFIAVAFNEIAMKRHAVKGKLKKSPYDYLKENNMLSVDALIVEAILVAAKLSTRPAGVRKYIEAISMNSLQRMMEFYRNQE